VDQIDAIRQLVRATSAEGLPSLIGALESVKAEAWARLSVPLAADVPRETNENVSVEEAARRLGISDRWLYKNAGRLPFVRRIGRRLLCSTRALANWNDRQRG
jgi:excisionase family DNA binding protein